MAKSEVSKGELFHIPTASPHPFKVRRGVGEQDAEAAASEWLNSSILEAMALGAGDTLQVARVLQDIHISVEHGHWNWVNKIKATRDNDGFCYECFELEADGSVQALMLIKYPHKSRLNQYSNIIYVDYLQVAPWNLANKYRTDRRYKGVGSQMLLVASNFCKELESEFGNGFALHSLPQSIDFYRALGMSELGADNSYHNLIYFEKIVEGVA